VHSFNLRKSQIPEYGPKIHDNLPRTNTNIGPYNYNNIKFEGYTSDWWSNGNFQTSTEVNNGDAYYTYVLGEKSIIGLDSSSPKTMGYSVRCIKD
jgi:hypothetical protein